VMAFIKPSAIAGVEAQPKREGESVMSTLNRALARTSV